MNDQLVKVVKRIEKVTYRLEKELRLADWWQIKHIFSESADGATMMAIDGQMPTQARTTACTMTQWQYRTAEITWYLPSVAIINDEKLDEIALHEYVHMLNAPMATFIFDYLKDDEPATEQIRALGQYGRLEEYVTESLARVIQLARGKDVPA